MKKIYLVVALLLIAVIPSLSKDVDSLTAAIVAKNFYLQNAGGASSVNLTLVYQCKIESFNPIAQQTGAHIYYVFDVNTNDGFVIVSGDDIVSPVIGYSVKGNYPIKNLPPEQQKWMEGYKGQIIMAKENNLSATATIEKAWSSLIAGTSHPASRGSVAPLLNTTWDQGNSYGYYNAQCPVDPSLPDQNNLTHRCPTGCAATAMAQIMKFWSYPATGTGFHSYYLSNYGTLSANFSNTTYNWSSMPDNVTSANAGVATLMFQCGVSIEMGYTADESGAWVISGDNAVCVQNALTTYFGYDATKIQGLYRSTYSDNDWDNLIENELSNGRPVQYVGFGPGGGHTWVCDGFDANNMFHMNWGWSGLADSYYSLDALNPTSTGAGGGLGEYNSKQEALIGIEPLGNTGGGGGGGGGGTIPTAIDIEMNSDIYVSPDPIDFDQPFTVNADVTNNDVVNFNGTIAACLFDLNGNFITYIDSFVTTTPLKPNYHYTNGLTFSNNGLLNVPGEYILGIYYKPTGGNWYSAGQDYYYNPVYVDISGYSNYDGINLNSSITTSPSSFVMGSSASVNVNLENDGYYTYYGTYQADLYDLNGKFVEEIGSYDETTGLPAGYTYQAPYISFSTNAITAAPGTYILAISELESSGSTWYLAGNTSLYTNPINIDVVAPPLLPDKYEPDNTEATAYPLPLNWSNNQANSQTTGSNFHITSDLDYYKINLPAGYDYTITARADDSYSSNNGNTYTADVVWSYNDGSGWSQSYDDVMPGNIVVNGTGEVTFLVAPYFAGITGTYLLDIQVARVAASGVENLYGDKPISIFPNPASSLINVEISADELQNLSLYNITNTMGQVVLTKTVSGHALQNIDVSQLSDGIYYFEGIGNKRRYIGKFVVTH